MGSVVIVHTDWVQCGGVSGRRSGEAEASASVCKRKPASTLLPFLIKDSIGHVTLEVQRRLAHLIGGVAIMANG